MFRSRPIHRRNRFICRGNRGNKTHSRLDSLNIYASRLFFLFLSLSLLSSFTWKILSRSNERRAKKEKERKRLRAVRVAIEDTSRSKVQTVASLFRASFTLFFSFSLVYVPTHRTIFLSLSRHDLVSLLS